LFRVKIVRHTISVSVLRAAWVIRKCVRARSARIRRWTQRTIAYTVVVGIRVASVPPATIKRLNTRFTAVWGFLLIQEPVSIDVGVRAVAFSIAVEIFESFTRVS
jgi:hypothetical protein